MEESNTPAFRSDAASSAVPLQRVLDRFDSYMGKKDYRNAEQLLLYWMQETAGSGDDGTRLSLCNELIGFYRKTEQKEKAFEAVQSALSILQRLPATPPAVNTGTSYVNIATAYNAFGQQQEALAYYEKAKEIYEASPGTPRRLLGGLYNNMALSCHASGLYSDADRYFRRALRIMEQVPGSAPERAVTCLNLADTVAAQKGLEEGEQEIFSLLDAAYALLTDPGIPRDGYYAFVCEKCAPGFSYYGYFAAAEELMEEAGKIYDRP